MRTVDDVIRQLNERGWAEALWAHHPPEVRAAIRAMGWRPQVKQCFANCQRFALARLLEVEYREGWIHAVIPMQHSWLVYQGRTLDLTLDPGRDVEYLESYAVPLDEVALAAVRRRAFGPVYPERLDGMKRLPPTELDKLPAALGAPGVARDGPGV